MNALFSQRECKKPVLRNPQKNLNSSGFSLVEMMVVLGILGLILAAAASGFVSIHKEQARITARQDLSSLINDVKLRLMSSKTCMSVVGGVRMSVSDITKAREHLDSTSSHPGKKLSIKLSSGATIYPGMAEYRDIPKTRLRVEYLSLVNLLDAGVDSSGVPIYSVDLYGGFSVNLGGTFLSFGRHSLGNTMIKIIANKVDSCFSAIGQDLGSLTKNDERICINFGGNWDQSSKKCSLNTEQVCSSLGLTWSGTKCEASNSLGGPCFINFRTGRPSYPGFPGTPAGTVTSWTGWAGDGNKETYQCRNGVWIRL